MIKNNFKNFFKNFGFFFINFFLISFGIIASAFFFLFLSSYLLKIQNSEFFEVMKEYLNTELANIAFVDIFNLHFLKKVFMDMIYIGESYGVNIDLYFFLVGAASIGIFFGAYKGSISLVDYLHKRKFRNKYTKHGFVSIIVKIIIGLVCSFIITLILFVTHGNALITIGVYFVLDALELLVVTYYIYFSEIKFKKFITSKNALKIIGLFFFSQSIFVLIAGLAWRYAPLISILLVLPFLAYSTTNTTYTVIDYFRKTI